MFFDGLIFLKEILGFLFFEFYQVVFDFQLNFGLLINFLELALDKRFLVLDHGCLLFLHCFYVFFHLFQFLILLLELVIF